MRKRIPTTIAIFLTACGSAGVVTENLAGEAEANAQQNASQRGGDNNQQRYNPRAGIDEAIAMQAAIDGGGIPGCFDPSLSGRERAVAERLGGVPCDGSASSGTAAADGWAGRYEGQFDGGRGLVNISAPTSAGYHQVQVEVAGGGCSGQATASARPSGNRMSLEIPVENNQGLCVIDLTRRGSTLSVGESYCQELHGMSCGFSGSAKRNQPRAAVQSAAPQGAAWLRGGWAGEGDYCASGNPLVFNADGRYGNSGGDVAGQWSLTGNTLSLRYAEVDPTSGEASGPQRRESHRITRVSANEMRLGQTRFRRCPGNGGAEPWHPGESFGAN